MIDGFLEKIVSNGNRVIYYPKNEPKIGEIISVEANFGTVRRRSPK